MLLRLMLSLQQCLTSESLLLAPIQRGGEAQHLPALPSAPCPTGVFTAETGKKVCSKMLLFTHTHTHTKERNVLFQIRKCVFLIEKKEKA